MNSWLQMRWPVCPVIVAFLLHILLPDLSRADVPIRVGNVHAAIVEKKLRITYDLEGSPNSSYDVRIELLRKNEARLRYVPNEELLRGAVGEVPAPGPKKMIVWEYARELKAVTGDDFYVIVYAKVHPSASAWWWILGGLAAGGGGYLIYKALTKNKDGQVDKFPTDPGRP